MNWKMAFYIAGGLIAVTALASKNISGFSFQFPTSNDNTNVLIGLGLLAVPIVVPFVQKAV